jgi:hypothetical protein
MSDMTPTLSDLHQFLGTRPIAWGGLTDDGREEWHVEWLIRFDGGEMTCVDAVTLPEAIRLAIEVAKAGVCQ